jgi:hypothetical protein
VIISPRKENAPSLAVFLNINLAPYLLLLLMFGIFFLILISKSPTAGKKAPF